jgi:uncharacterized membrane protein YbaN (DUF454 family)
MVEQEPTPGEVMTRVKRAVYVLLGCFFVGLAVLGLFLPVLPTTPFLLLASFFFIRSWPALNHRLLHSPVFGALLRDWQRHRGVRRHTKITAVAVIVVVAGASVVLGRLSLPLLLVLLPLACIGIVVVLRLPEVKEPNAAPVAVPVSNRDGMPLIPSCSADLPPSEKDCAAQG